MTKSGGGIPKTVTVTRYTGGNSTIDKYLDETEWVWMVNGKKGRKVVILSPHSTKHQAWERYRTQFIEQETK